MASKTESRATEGADLDALALRAQTAFEKGEWAVAARTFEALIRDRPQEIDSRYSLSKAHLELGHFDEAVEALKHPSIAGRDKTNRRLAMTLIEAKRYEEAIPLVDALLAGTADSAKFAKWKYVCETSLRIQRGEDLVAADRLGEAEQLYIRLLADFPDLARAYLHLGQIYAHQRRWPEAIVRLRAGFEVEPENLKLRIGLARALFKNGDVAGAVALLGDCAECESDIESQLLLQRCFIELHDWSGVGDIGKRLLGMLADDDPLRDVVARSRVDAFAHAEAEQFDALSRAGDVDRAMEGYRQVTARNPQSPVGWVKLGNALADAGRDEEAVAVFGEALKLHPQNAEIRTFLTRLVLKRPDDETRLRYVEGAIEAGNADFECFRWLARYRAEREDWSAALESATQALALDPENSSARVLLVRALLHVGRLPEALDEVETLLASGEKHVEALQLKGDILVRLSRVDEAITAYCRGLRLARRDASITERLNCALLMKAKAEDYQLRTLDELPISIDPAQFEAVLRPFQGFEVDDRRWNKRHRKMWRSAVDRVSTGRESKRDRELVEQEYAVWATMGFDRYRTDRQELRGAPWSWRGQRLFLDGAAAARIRAVIFSAVLKHLNPRRVLEVGSGNGINLLSLAGAFPAIEFVGLELTPEGVDEARRAQNDAGIRRIIHDYTPLKVADPSAIQRIGFVQGDASALPFKSDSFDLVLTVLAVEQMESIRSAALSEIARVSRRHVLMLEPFRDMNQDGLKGLYAHSRGYFCGSIRELGDFGLEPIWATADFPQETFLGTALVLSNKARPLLTQPR